MSDDGWEWNWLASLPSSPMLFGWPVSLRQNLDFLRSGPHSHSHSQHATGGSETRVSSRQGCDSVGLCHQKRDTERALACEGKPLMRRSFAVPLLACFPRWRQTNSLFVAVCLCGSSQHRDPFFPLRAPLSALVASRDPTHLIPPTHVPTRTAWRRAVSLFYVWD